MKYLGYARVSTKEQKLDRQEANIRQFCQENDITLFKDKVYTESFTGKSMDRPVYNVVRELLDKGDTLIVSELDRLGRSKQAVMEELHYMRSHNIKLVVLEIPTTYMVLKLDEQNDLNKMLLETINNMLIEMYASFAEAEVRKREERQRQGMQAMKDRGEWERYGRPRTLAPEVFEAAYKRVLAGEVKPFEMIKELDIPVGTYYRYKSAYDKARKKEEV